MKHSILPKALGMSDDPVCSSDQELEMEPLTGGVQKLKDDDLKGGRNGTDASALQKVPSWYWHLMIALVLSFFIGGFLLGSLLSIVVTSSSSIPKVQRRVYIDLGANWANTLRLYRDIPLPISRGPWEVYAFEASPFIQPYIENFVLWLNGEGRKPAITVPPSGSSLHLVEHAELYGCPRSPVEQMRQCMFQVFERPLAALERKPQPANWSLINSRLAMAGQFLQPSSSRDRYVFVPAAAGARTGTVNLGNMTAQQMIRGGAHSDDSTGGGGNWSAPVVDFVSWLTANFRQEDYVIVKMDIEGAEFEVLMTLLNSGFGCLVDVLAWECHDFAGNCRQLQRELNRWSCIKKMSEGSAYDGWDSESTPEKYHAEDPRSLLKENKHAELNGTSP